MPNLIQIKALRDKYIRSGTPSFGTREIRLLTENFQKNANQIENAFRMNGGNPNFLQFFEFQKSANLVLLFIDITNFSTKMHGKENQYISTYLDHYYDIVIPKIYLYGGEIEKIIGDGIICIFGEPFLELTKTGLFTAADACAKDIIATLKNSDKEVKIALHDGQIMYYKNKSLNYPEYTVIGNPLTELFRLESVSYNNSINYYSLNTYDNLDCSNKYPYWIESLRKVFYWDKSGHIKVELKGVSWPYIKKIECTN